MLHRLEIENFYSIRDRQIIDLRASAAISDNSSRLAPLWKGAVEKAPKVVALFGANASGKSNVLKAISFIAWFVRDSFSTPRGSRMPFDRFNDATMLRAPTRLAVHVSGAEDITRLDTLQCRFAYEVIIEGGSQTVQAEGLHYWPSSASRKVKLFDRDASGVVKASKAFGLKGFNQALSKVLRPDASVIATLAQLEHPFSKLLSNMAQTVVGHILGQKNETTDEIAIRHYAANPKLVDVFNREVERIDFGVKAMQVEQGPNGPIALFTHDGLEVPMPMVYESEGTRQFVKLYPILLNALETGELPSSTNWMRRSIR